MSTKTITESLMQLRDDLITWVSNNLATKSNANHIHDDYKLIGDFALLTGTIVTPAEDDSTLSAVITLNYPSGFNMDNCVIMSVMSTIEGSDTSKGWATPMDNSVSASSFYGSYSLAAILRESHVAARVDKIAVTQESQTINVKVVLMKI